MRSSILAWSLRAIAVLLFLDGAGNPAAAQPMNPISPATVEGFVTAVNPGAGTITIRPEGGAAVTLTVTDTSLIKHNGKVAPLDKILKNDRAIAYYDRTTGNVIELRSYTPRTATTVPSAGIAGIVTAVDAAAGTLTIKPVNGAPVTVTVTAATSVHHNMQLVPLAQVLVGDHAIAYYDPTSNKAIEIRAYTPTQQPQPQRASIFGTVTAVDATAGKLTIQPPMGAAVTVTITAATTIHHNMAPAKLAQILVGDHALAHYEPASGKALDVFSYTPKPPMPQPPPQGVFAGVVTAVDAMASTLTIKPIVGAALTLKVTANTTIKHNGQRAALAQILVGDHAYGTYETATGNALEIRAYTPTQPQQVQRASAFGIVTAVDVAGGKLTIQPPMGAAVTVTIAATTTIIHNQKLVDLAKVLVDDHALILYETASGKALVVLAYTPPQK
jgi:uncharacterized ubiquitin-like protein YukD